MKINKKISILFITFVGAVALFIFAIVLQNKITNPNGKADIYLAKRFVSKNTIITKKNINYYFDKSEVSKDRLIDSPAAREYDLIGKYVTEDILKNEPISTKLFNDESRRKTIENLRETSIKADDISQVVGGTLREGDLIDIILTQSASDNEDHKTVSETKLKNIEVSKAFTSDGKEIKREDSNNYSATVLNLKLSAKDAVKLDNATAKGKIKIIKVLDNTTYQDIKIEN